MLTQLASLCLVCLYHLPLLLVSAQNIDRISPTIVDSGLISSEGGFGWSIAQYLSADGIPYVLVSAPKSDANSSREGRVYRCPFDNRQTCQYEPIFTSREVEDSSFVPVRLNTGDSYYARQLMGYSLKSFGSRIVACAPLYIHEEELLIINGESYILSSRNGRCIILNSALDIHLQVFSGSVDGELSLAGLDVELLNEEKLILPSSFTGSSPHAGKILETNVLIANNYGGGSLPVRSTPTLQAPYDALLGYHVDKGYFTILNNLQIVASSPRSNSHFGKVEVMNSNDFGISSVYTIFGEEADGYFGYDFAVLDLGQEQGYNSLVIGCPLCARERGRVYIYVHTGSPADPFSKSVLESPSLIRGRFGLTVAEIGDSDLDGLSDVAIAAPYEGRGVVYIFRGSESGLVTTNYQTLNAVENTNVFGYSLSGGLDIDSNGYPDVTVGDLQGERVTTFRGSPLVSVTIEILDLKDKLDVIGTSDKHCPQPSNNILLNCFNVTPCFYYQTRRGNVSQFALSYTLAVDKDKSRVGIYKSLPGGEVIIGGTQVTRSLIISGPGRQNMMCADTVTFALSENILDINFIPVSVSVDNIPDPLALELDPSQAHFGDPLHPTLILYSRGDTPSPRTAQYQIEMNANCSFGDPDICEGDIGIGASEILNSTSTTLNADGRVALTLSNEFGFSIDVINRGMDTAINPTLIISLPPQTLLSRTVPSLPCDLRTSPTSNEAQLDCVITNLMSSRETFSLEVYFIFNDTTPLLNVGSLNISFSGLDGNRSIVTDTVSRSIRLFASAEYRLSSRIAEPVYRGLRSAVVFPNPGTLSLTQVGPRITLSVTVQISRGSSTFPHSTLHIYLPVEVVDEESGESKPLIIPTSIAMEGDNVNCSQFEVIPQGLSSSQKAEASILPEWTGARPPSNPQCEKNGSYRCGIVLCTIFDLRPPPEKPHEITLFSRLYSPTINDDDKFVEIHKRISSETNLPTVGENSIDVFYVPVTLSPGTREVQRDCIRYWVVVVSVVIGISALVAIIAIFGLFVLCYRWYKHRKASQEDSDQTDNEYSYHHRAIPPIPGLNNGTAAAAPPPPPPPEEQWSYGRGVVASSDDKEMEKMDEADLELEKELKEMAMPPQGKRVSTTSSLAHVDLTFDPSLGLDEEYEGGLETDL